MDMKGIYCLQVVRIGEYVFIDTNLQLCSALARKAFRIGKKGEMAVKHHGKLERGSS